MPTVLRSGPYRLFFYSGDRDEPPHVHAERDDGEAKFWLDPIQLERSRGLTAKDLKRMRALIESRQIYLLEKWNEYFGA